MHLENTPNINNPESNLSEMGADINNIGERLEGKLAPEELEKLKVEEKREQSELSPEQQLTTLGEEGEARQQEITRLTESVKRTKAKVNEIRKELGLPPTEEDPPTVFSEKDKLEKLQAEHEALEKQREEFISQRERERLIREEKENILQEKLDELFKEFESLNTYDFESIFEGGKTREGTNVESASLGELDPEIAKSLARAFKEGIKLLPKILETLPELLKAFNEDLTKEATERVEQKLEEEKAKMEKGRTKGEKAEVPDNGIPAGEREPNTIDPSSFEEKSVEANLKQGEKPN